MIDINMSDVFNLPLPAGELHIDNDFKSHRIISLYAETAINAYDANQERITELKAALTKIFNRLDAGGCDEWTLMGSQRPL